MSITHCSVINKRDYQEDAYVIKTNIVEGMDLLAIFDGHMGGQSSEYCKNRIIQYLQVKLSNLHTVDIPHILYDVVDRLHHELLGSPIKYTSNTHHDFKRYHKLRGRQIARGSGTTATITIIDHVNNCIYVAITGDSPCLLIRDKTVVEMTTIHKVPSVPVKTKSWVTNNNYICVFSSSDKCTSISVGRSLGDSDFRKGYNPTLDRDAITHLPDVYKWNYTDGDILLMASDGIDVITDLELACISTWNVNRIVGLAIRKGATDNITCIKSIL